MTRAEILNCLTDRPCDSCKFHESGRCERWNCVFEEKPDDCEDAISRQAALDKAVYTETEEGWSGRTVDVKDIEALPPVTPKQKTGRWIEDDDPEIINPSTKCSLCGGIALLHEDEGGYVVYALSDYCPSCGAKMENAE